MKKKTFLYLFILFLFLFSKSNFAQELSLELTSINQIENKLLQKIDYQKKHKDSISVKREIYKITNYLKSKGYFTNTLDSIKKTAYSLISYFSLNEKTESAVITLPHNKIDIKNVEVKNNSFSIPIEKLQPTLLQISKTLDYQGKSFSKVNLKNIKLKNKILFADLEVLQSKKRNIDKVIIKGYDAFPKSYIKHFFNINDKTIFNKDKIIELTNESKSLQFIKEIKPPEVLFKKDSTLLYMYLKKHQNNSFDGLINFASKENGDILFNGHVDLKINNTLNRGEKFELFWNSIGDERQEFKISTEVPYIFNSVFTPNISFSIYKQDSTFLNTTFNAKLFYNLNSRVKIAFTYDAENSENLQEKISNNIETFNNYFLGFKFVYSIPKNDFFFNDKFSLEINPNLGKRKTKAISSNQFKLETTASYLWDISDRSSIFIRNSTGFLNSDDFIDNELFRIGGANSIRGFNEQSIYTKRYTFFNLEYRFLSSQKSYLYTILDIGNINTTFKNENLLGIGLGYLFTTKNSQINLSTITGKNSSKNFDFKNSKLIISWKSYF
ncbi:hypothetical protein H9W90_08495 [Polaribacter pectinis]|uniref:Haemolysin activator HlyB C-terminal domain-containing protein n=1 Tax=Polaribacter pectinis TaxID=2738844 RepID=A0A7G9L6K1_9FLAO|nr:ShlB/FhaC/HecB family hemolysin secretion/activation protein [Polaribacter pectinis]QNM84250.1 hypothetical protein H9W90_08495 [Polaribacter pectinis]